MQSQALAPNPFAPRRYGELHKVTERVYILRNITNSTFIVGDASVAVIDTQVNRPTARQLLAFVRSVTDKPISHVINTHYHWDHTNGNQIFKDEGATVVSSALTRRFMVERADRQKEFLSGRGFDLGKDPFLPEVTFEGETSIDLGNTPLRLFFAGRAETDDATAVHAPTEGIVLAGDTVMTGSFPIFGQPVWDEGLQDRQWSETIAKILSLSPRHIVPGHGPLAGEAEVRRLLEIEAFFLEEVGKLVTLGLSADEMLRDLEPRIPAWMRAMPVVWGTPRYAALRVWRGLTRKPGDTEPGWQRFKPSAIPAADLARVEKALAAKSVAPVGDYLSMAEEAKEGGDPGLRLSVLKKATERFPDSDEALTAYAEALIEESRSEPSVLEKGDFFSEARRAWDAVLARQPRHAGALLGKGRYLTMMAYRGGDDPAEGMRLLEAAAELVAAGRPRAEAEFYLGIGHRRLGDEPRARRQFARALEFDPSFMPARIASV